MKFRSRHLNLLFMLAALALILPATLQAQVIGSTTATETSFGGRHFINGRVVGPDGKPVYQRIRIRLSSSFGGDVLATTDDEGKFIFTRLSDGTYTLTVDEDVDHGPAMATVDINQGDFPMATAFYATLRLSEKKSGLKPPQVISSETATVPKGAMTFYNKAIELSKAGDHKGAIEQLNLAIAHDPQFLDALTEIGIQYLILGELEKADAALVAALKVKPDAYEPLVNRGIVLVRLKKFAEAETALQNAIKANASGLAYYYLGRALVGLQRPDDAIEAFNTAIKTGSDDVVEAHRMLASAYIDKMDDKKAIGELETYLKLNPTAPDAPKLRQVIAQLRGPKQASPPPAKPQ